MATLVIDADKCILGGECIYNHPDYFDWADDDSVAVVIKPTIETDADLLHAEQAIALCPGGAVSLQD